MKRADGPYGKGVVNDLFIPGLLPRAGIVSDTDKSLANGGVLKMARTDQATGRVGSPVELLREARPFRSRGTLRDLGDQGVDDLICGSGPRTGAPDGFSTRTGQGSCRGHAHSGLRGLGFDDMPGASEFGP